MRANPIANPIAVAAGRRAQSLPPGLAAAMNLHAYVGNDPVNLTDPDGLDQEDGRS
jgi:hypothetical protein